MANVTVIGSGNVYEFPVLSRKSGGRRFDAAAVVTDFRPKPSLVVDYSNWYHQEALRDAETKPQS
ncbi:DUF2735 domain-containing protein [Pararhizobium gei]|uniref:DUF2735 domain-containing protein n=1 Tax=Pararhizobium gei TaxID=1395951 RepID=UPI0023D9983B|nr:DUF2735 domain-containing protein [Rhizobium gei]